MKFQHIALTILAFAFLTIFAACKKEDKTPPTVSVTAPLDGAGFAAGATVNITGTVEDETALMEAVIEVTAGSNDSLVYTKTIDVSGKTASVSGSYVLNLVSGTLFEVHIEATDAAGNAFDEHAHLHVN
jgi:hypothetical protein